MPEILTDQRLVAADKIDALLPQTQCGQCGYAGCRPYAVAIAEGNAQINQCPPGGAAGIAKLAFALGREFVPLNPANGVEEPLRLAVVEEAYCIGCTLCIQACPVDAIVGAAKQMHTVIAELCTGCKLCVPPCPVDCIRLEPAPFTWSPLRANAARHRYDNRKRRLSAERHTRSHAGEVDEGRTDADPFTERKRAVIEAAVERAQRVLHATLDSTLDSTPDPTPDSTLHSRESPGTAPTTLR